MKKLLLSVAVIAAMGFSTGAKAQLVDEQNVTITMDLQPILQLKMNGPQNIDFVFDQISEYVGGITKYGATQLMVSSTVNWDLYAVGFSSTGANFWDQQLVYGAGTDPNAITNLPIQLLEMHQDKANPAPGTATNFADYNAAFVATPVVTGSNNIYASATPYVEPADGEKYIAGGNTAVATAFVPGGTYLVQNPYVAPPVGNPVGGISDYYYTIDYRIVPGLPAIFPNAASNDGATAYDLVTQNAAGAFAQPGVYTMNVKYVLMENN